MNREDQNFDQLRRLLKLKRYEQPPPRYFNDFSSQVVARLKSGQNSGKSDTWFQRLWGAMELKPLVPAAFGAAICGLLVAGAVYTENSPEHGLNFSNALAPFEGGVTSLDPAPNLPSHAPEIGLASFSTNPVPSSSLFDQIRPGLQPPMRVAHPLFR